MSYGQVLGYTHSGHSLSILYGFASLFVIGFLWGAIGGAGTALPAVLDRRELTEFFAPMSLIFAAWWGQDIFVDWFVSVDSAYRQESLLYWYDTDWLGVLIAIAAVLLLALVRRRLDQASTLILYMAVGWWVGFVLLVLLLGWRMTPPRGDNWAGCLGMTGAMIFYFERRGWRELTRVALICGFAGGYGFALANLIKLLGVATGWATNWHSVMEQLYGAINGIGVALALIYLSRKLAPVSDDPPVRRWTDIYAVCFVLVGITYLNLRRNPPRWIEAKTVPAAIVGLPAEVWFGLAYLAIAVLIGWLLYRHLRHPLGIIPSDLRARGQLFYLIFLWWVVVGNFERSVVAFAPTRLITEGVIFLNAILCTGLLLFEQPGTGLARVQEGKQMSWPLQRTVLRGMAVLAIGIVISWGTVKLMFGDQVAGNIKRQIRFGAEATATKEKPAAGQPHP